MDRERTFALLHARNCNPFRSQISSRQRLGATALCFLAVLLAGPRGSSAQGGTAAMAFGPTSVPVEAFGTSPFTGAYINASGLAQLQLRLPEARKYGLRLIVKLAPPHDTMMSPTTGCFDIQLWKDAIDKMRSFDFAPYVADGTVVGAELVNEPHASDWCLSTPMRLTKENVEEMAAYAKRIWPTLPVGCGRSDWVLANAPWRYLDFSNSQYHMRKGDIETWRTTTVQEAKSAGVGLLLSLNFLAGQLDNSPMTADQLLYYGSALARDSYSCMLTGYSYDAAYMAQPGVLDVFKTIVSIARSHPAPPCFVGSAVKPVGPRPPTNVRVVK